MSTAGCFGFIQISDEDRGLFRFAALDYTGPHSRYFDEHVADFLGYAVGRDQVTDFLCVCSPPGLPIQGGPVAISPPATLLQKPGLRTHLIDPGRRATLMLGHQQRLIPVWFVGSRIRIVNNPVTGDGDLYVPLNRGAPVTVELRVGNPKLGYILTEYQVVSACAAAA